MTTWVSCETLFTQVSNSRSIFRIWWLAVDVSCEVHVCGRCMGLRYFRCLTGLFLRWTVDGGPSTPSIMPHHKRTRSQYEHRADWWTRGAPLLSVVGSTPCIGCDRYADAQGMSTSLRIVRCMRVVDGNLEGVQR